MSELIRHADDREVYLLRGRILEQLDLMELAMGYESCLSA